MTGPPPLEGILETVVYCTTDTETPTRAFYEEVMGFRRLWEGGFAHRVGEKRHVFLVFNSDESAHQESPPPHGARGSVHTCFVTTPDDFDSWRKHLESRDVDIVGELEWGDGKRSFYFSDPAGNLLEIADGDMWD